MTFRPLLPTAILFFLSACDFVAPQADSGSLPVVEGILVAGLDSQFISVRLARSADSAFDRNAPDTRPDSISFQVTGNGTTVAATAFRTTSLQIPFRIYPDSTYSIAGLVDGIPISATTTVPHAVIVDDPLGDTLVVDSIADCAYGSCMVPVAVRGDGAFGYSLEFRALDGRLRLRDRIDGGASLLSLDRSLFQTSATVDFLGLDENAASFVQQTEPRSNIIGGFGVFGSAVAVRKSVRLE